MKFSKELIVALFSLSVLAVWAQKPAEPIFETEFSPDGKTVRDAIAPHGSVRLSGGTRIADSPIGKVFVFDGKVGSSAEITDPKLNLPEEFTVSGWFCASVLPLPANPAQKQSAGLFCRGWKTRSEIGPSGNIWIQFESNKEQFTMSSRGKLVQACHWTHLAFTYSLKNKKYEMFVNGERVGSGWKNYKEIEPEKNNSGNVFMMGSLPNYFPLDGMVGRSRVYAEALSAEAVNDSERDIAVLLLKHFREELSGIKVANETLTRIDAFLQQQKIPLSAVADLSRKVVNLKATQLLIDKGVVTNDTCYYTVVDPTSQNMYNYDSPLPEEGINGKLLVAATPGEYEEASFIVTPLHHVKSFIPRLGGFRNESGDTIGPEAVDIRLAKLMFFVGGGKSRLLCPVVLLHDDALVKVDLEKQENYLRYSFPDGEKYVCISKDGTGKELFNLFMPVEKFPIHDSPILKPVSLTRNRIQQYWLTLKVPDNAAPGLYTSRIDLLADGKCVSSIPFKLRVLPFKLPAPATNYDPGREFHSAIYYRAYNFRLSDPSWKGSIGTTGKNLAQFKEELKNLKEHGVNDPYMVISVPFTRWHWRIWNSNEQGSLLEITQKQRDYTVRFLKTLFESGMDARPVCFQSDTSNAGFEMFYEKGKHEEALKKIIKDAQDMVQEACGHREIMFYARDEATGKMIPQQYPVWKDIRANGAGVFATGLITDVKNVAGHVDVYVASNVPRRDCAREIREKGGEKARIWSYANPMASTMYDAYIYRKNYGYKLYHANYDGACSYSYNSCAGDPWNPFDSSEIGLAFILPTADGVLDTPSWQGYREARDDVRYATKLRQEILRVKKSGSPEAVKLAERAHSFLENMKVDDPNFDPSWTRLQIIGLILELIGK